MTLAFLLTAALVACTSGIDQPAPEASSPSSDAGDSAPAAPPEELSVETFTSDDLFAQGGGGCGMTLWEQENSQRSQGYLFFNGLPESPDPGFALMKLNGEFVRFRRTAAAGEEFYGQRTSQTFISQDEATQLQVNTSLGQPGEIESVAVEGTLQLQRSGNTLKIPVQGDAGC
ncbi:hypothetical protein [Nodosilinea nodulosa]|uniref:hypothetical protein n=1 Tax=Nodosilinea nodulosa TaxID=416001 RepID=UPI0003192471|nr:hypothetical protein [Nodosilinea nodulosa]